jgi:hypothetical protein
VLLQYLISYCVVVAVDVDVVVVVVVVVVVAAVVVLGGLLYFNRDVVADVCLSYYLY